MIQLSKLNTDSQEWEDPVFKNNASNFGSGYDTVGYLKDGLGFVHIKGMAHMPTTGKSMFTLPVGYRPAAILQFVSIVGGGFGVVNVGSDGNVSRVVGSEPTTSLNVIFKAT